MVVKHDEMLSECRQRMEAMETLYASEFKHLNEKLASFDAFLAGRITETRDWLASISRKIEGNGTTGYEARLKGLEILVGENAKAISALAVQSTEDKKEGSRLQDKIMDTAVQVVVNGAIWGGVMYALWEKGMLSK